MAVCGFSMTVGHALHTLFLGVGSYGADLSTWADQMAADLDENQNLHVNKI